MHHDQQHRPRPSADATVSLAQTTSQRPVQANRPCSSGAGAPGGSVVEAVLAGCGHVPPYLSIVIAALPLPTVNDALARPQFTGGAGSLSERLMIPVAPLADGA